MRRPSQRGHGQAPASIRLTASDRSNTGSMVAAPVSLRGRKRAHSDNSRLSFRTLSWAWPMGGQGDQAPRILRIYERVAYRGTAVPAQHRR